MRTGELWWTAAAAAVVLLVLLPTVGLVLVTDLQKPRARFLRVGPLVLLSRRVRSAFVQGVCELAGAPHLVDVVTGLSRTPVALTPRTSLGNYGPAVLWRYGPGTGQPVLLVHSVVTTPTVLDLRPGSSLVASLVEAGHDVLLLDWGRPTARQALAGLDAYLSVLSWAEDLACRVTGRERLDVVGYCFGGTLALALHARYGTDRLASLAVVAAPVDTQVTGGMGRFLGSRALMPVLALDGHGLVPGRLVREGFHALRPRGWQTARTAWRLRKDPSARAGIGALNRWAWDHPSLPGALLFDVVRLFRTNSLVRGELVVHGEKADLRRLAGTPLLVATTVQDHIVPPASTTALASVPGLAPELLQCPSGHVAMLVGREAQTVLVPGVLRWLEASRARVGG